MNLPFVYLLGRLVAVSKFPLIPAASPLMMSDRGTLLRPSNKKTPSGLFRSGPQCPAAPSWRRVRFLQNIKARTPVDRSSGLRCRMGCEHDCVLTARPYSIGRAKNQIIDTKHRFVRFYEELAATANQIVLANFCAHNLNNGEKWVLVSKRLRIAVAASCSGGHQSGLRLLSAI